MVQVVDTSSRYRGKNAAGDERTIGNSIAQHLKGEERLSGKLGEAINELLRNFTEAALD